ncbi:hypothetical protein Dalk_2618 [Desulfatibacillum aliphaticivorans]|uniref:Uncharacterized protein n=1 Tax=Desulfatibacillum aliphaticivorans TaxID=218208 RepID=B8FIS0_DESAL|nr:hypothetical protein [Desulfatibacillum aliphaticivorans]ACL04311.1 hypothetical protein Dalk_2618 [Desulfatibacillum aliphaticivorans]
MLEIHTLDEFKNAFEAKSDEILVADPDLAKKFIIFDKVKKYLGIAGPVLNAEITKLLVLGERRYWLMMLPPDVLFIPLMGLNGFSVCVELGAALGGVKPLKEFKKTYVIEPADGGDVVLRRRQ